MSTAHHPPRDARFATTLAHGLALLESFDAGHAALTNKEMAERSGLSKATVSRLSSTLQAHGLIEFEPGERHYRLSSAALTLGYPLLAGLDIRREARLGMKQLADELGGSVSLGLRERTRMIYVETSRGSNPIAFRPDVGAALPMLQTAMGRAWLAAAPEALRRDVLQLLRTATPAAWAQWKGSVEPAIAHLQRHGFCVSHADWQSDVYAVAVPLDTPTDAEPMVINCGVPIRGLRS